MIPEERKIIFDDMVSFFGESEINRSVLNYPKRFEYYFHLMNFYKSRGDSVPKPPAKLEEQKNE